MSAAQKPASINNTEIDSYFASHLRGIIRQGLGVNKKTRAAAITNPQIVPNHTIH